MIISALKGLHSLPALGRLRGKLIHSRQKVRT